MQIAILEDNGLTVTGNGREFHIPNETIAGICSVLVNGRDIEDGYAPVQVIAAIIESHLRDDGPYKLIGPEDKDNWLTMPIEPDGDGQGETPLCDVVGLEVTGLEAALSHLIMLGGSRDSISLTKEA